MSDESNREALTHLSHQLTPEQHDDEINVLSESTPQEQCDSELWFEILAKLNDELANFHRERADWEMAECQDAFAAQMRARGSLAEQARRAAGLNHEAAREELKGLSYNECRARFDPVDEPARHGSA